MKFTLEHLEEKDDVFIGRDWTGNYDKGLVGHFIAEMELAKQELLLIWEELSKEEERNKGK